VRTATATSAGEGVVLIVGYALPLLDALAVSLPEKSVVIIDEPDVLRKRNAEAAVRDSPMLHELIGWEYMREAAADCFYHRFRALRPIAVIPFAEYGVPFAARLAERYGVPGAGYGAARLLRDKHLQRQVTAAAGIANPQSVPVTSPAEVRKFMTETGGPVVLKPANRAGAVGTKILHDPAEAEEAWTECEEQDEGVFVPDRPLPLRMLAEQFIEGDEFSVEMMFRAGRPEFSAVTKKFLFPGPRPVEQGHLHPADINDDLAGRLISGTVGVLDATGMDTGFAHCEWIVSDGRPYLVECAGRMAGDGIIDMIQVAWDYDVLTQFCTVMRGQPLTQKPSATAVRYTAMWTSSGPAGRVTAVEGVPEAEASPGVHSVVVKKIGRPIHGLHSSWDRLTAVIAEGTTPAEALANAQRAVNRVTVTIEPDQEATESTC
jgi:biotin carboxylase